MSAIYAIIFGMPDQQKLATEHCMGDCGKACLGAINDPELGELLPCATPAAECPYFEREMDKPFGTITEAGRESEVFLRKLQPVRRELPSGGRE